MKHYEDYSVMPLSSNYRLPQAEHLKPACVPDFDLQSLKGQSLKLDDVAVLIMNGGVGSRMQAPGEAPLPKGLKCVVQNMFGSTDLTMLEAKLRALKALGKKDHVYVMNSKDTHEQTVSLLGSKPLHVQFYEQGIVPSRALNAQEIENHFSSEDGKQNYLQQLQAWSLKPGQRLCEASVSLGAQAYLAGGHSDVLKSLLLQGEYIQTMLKNGIRYLDISNVHHLTSYDPLLLMAMRQSLQNSQAVSAVQVAARSESFQGGGLFEQCLPDGSLRKVMFEASQFEGVEEYQPLLKEAARIGDFNIAHYWLDLPGILKAYGLLEIYEQEQPFGCDQQAEVRRRLEELLKAFPVIEPIKDQHYNIGGQSLRLPIVKPEQMIQSLITTSLDLKTEFVKLPVKRFTSEMKRAKDIACQFRGFYLSLAHQLKAQGGFDDAKEISMITLNPPQGDVLFDKTEELRKDELERQCQEHFNVLSRLFLASSVQKQAVVLRLSEQDCEDLLASESLDQAASPEDLCLVLKRIDPLLLSLCLMPEFVAQAEAYHFELCIELPSSQQALLLKTHLGTLLKQLGLNNPQIIWGQACQSAEQIWTLNGLSSLNLSTLYALVRDTVSEQDLKDYPSLSDLEQDILRLQSEEDEQKFADLAKHVQSWSVLGRSVSEVLDMVVKEYDIRGFDGKGDAQKYPQQFDQRILRSLGRALASARFDSQAHGKTVALKEGDAFVLAGDNGPSTAEFRKFIGLGLRDCGVRVIDLGMIPSGQLYSAINRFEGQGGLYVTRSHVEVGTNGFKPVVGNITLYAEMLQELKRVILAQAYRFSEQQAELCQGAEWTERSNQEHFAYLKTLFKGLGDQLGDLKVAVNMGGGAATAEGYAELMEDILGANLKKLIRKEGDPYAENGLPDPSRSDDVALGHVIDAPDDPELHGKSAVQYSQENPDTVVFSFDLDVDRIGILWAGQLYLGDAMFYPIIDYVLHIEPNAEYRKFSKDVFVDSRMNLQMAQLAQNRGGVAKLHPKGHSKIKASIDLEMAKLAKVYALDKGYANAQDFSVRQFVQETGFALFQGEFSLHLFTTNNQEPCNFGLPGDDAIRFMFHWLDLFSKLKAHYASQGQDALNWTLQDYIDYLLEQNLIRPNFMLKEQRSFMPDSAKKRVNILMKDKLMEAFENSDDFEFVPSWKDYEQQSTKITLIDVEGVYHMKTPLGDYYWGWSNTSPKTAFGAQSESEQNLKKLTSIMLNLFMQCRSELASELGEELPSIDDKETVALQELFAQNSSLDVEKLVQGEALEIREML